MKTEIIVKQGDITKEMLDAVVNAANYTLLGGGGVDGAIHAVAGSGLFDECAGIGGCRTGEAVITRGYELPAKYVIHAVGPVYGRENGREDNLLQGCYRQSLELARKNSLKTIAFPCISTGAFRFPNERAAQIAVNTVNKYIKENPDVFEKIIFVTYRNTDFEIYNKLLK